MPPRILARYPAGLFWVTGPFAHQSWFCRQDRGNFESGADAVHARWTGLLLMAELSVGHARYGEPRWLRRIDGTWFLRWQCRRCLSWTFNPDQHSAEHEFAERLRLARLQSFGPLRDA